MNYIEQLMEQKKWEETILSYGWTTGGTWGSCWDDSLNTVSPSAPESLTEFTKYKQIIEYFLGDSPRKLKKYGGFCEVIEGSGDSDYYGGSTTSNQWSCNTRELIEEILEDKYGISDDYSLVNIQEKAPDLLKDLEDE